MQYQNSGGIPGIEPRRGLPGMRSKLAGLPRLQPRFWAARLQKGQVLRMRRPPVGVH